MVPPISGSREARPVARHLLPMPPHAAANAPHPSNSSSAAATDNTDGTMLSAASKMICHDSTTMRRRRVPAKHRHGRRALKNYSDRWRVAFRTAGSPLLRSPDRTAG